MASSSAGSSASPSPPARRPTEPTGPTDLLDRPHHSPPRPLTTSASTTHHLGRLDRPRTTRPTEHAPPARPNAHRPGLARLNAHHRTRPGLAQPNTRHHLGPLGRPLTVPARLRPLSADRADRHDRLDRTFTARPGPPGLADPDRLSEPRTTDPAGSTNRARPIRLAQPTARHRSGRLDRLLTTDPAGSTECAPPTKIRSTARAPACRSAQSTTLPEPSKLDHRALRNVSVVSLSDRVAGLAQR
jgi:hypothetical protein